MVSEDALSSGKTYTNALGYLGITVEVQSDRPLGSVHLRHDDIYYPVNYGFIPGTLSPDGAKLDAYVLGVLHRLRPTPGGVLASFIAPTTMTTSSSWSPKARRTPAAKSAR